MGNNILYEYCMCRRGSIINSIVAGIVIWRVRPQCALIGPVTIVLVSYKRCKISERKNSIAYRHEYLCTDYTYRNLSPNVRYKYEVSPVHCTCNFLNTRKRPDIRVNTLRCLPWKSWYFLKVFKYSRLYKYLFLKVFEYSEKKV